MAFEDRNEKIVCIIQARMGASRLPGKVLMDICGYPMLNWVVERASMAETVDEVWVATTTAPSDDPIEAYCDDQGYAVYRGSEQDVLDRFYQCAKLAEADVVIRLTADCPLIDPELIDQVVFGLFELEVDFSATRLPPPFHRTFPIGLDVEAVFFEGLEQAWLDATTKYQREHVMPFFYEDEDSFDISILQSEEDFGDYRWTVDTIEDLDVVKRLAASFGGNRDFDWLDVLEVFEANPEWQEINVDVNHKTYFDVDDRLNDTDENQENPAT